MSYTPDTLIIAPWQSPIPIEESDYIGDLDNAVNSIISTDPQSLTIHMNAEMAKIPPYLTAELEKINVQVEDNVDLSEAWATGTEPAGAGTFSSREYSEQAGTSASGASTSASEASSSAGEASTSAGEASSSAGEAQASETGASNSEAQAYVSAERAEGYLCANVPPPRDCMVSGTLQVVNGVAVWVGTGCPTLDIEVEMTTMVAPTFEGNGTITVAEIQGATGNSYRITSSNTTTFKFLDTANLVSIKITDGSTLEDVKDLCSGATELLSFQWYGSTYRGINIQKMCYGCSLLTTLHIDSTLVSSSAYSVFEGCSSMVSFDNIRFEGVGSMIMMSSTFKDCTSLLSYNVPLSNWDENTQSSIAGGQNLESNVFKGCTSLVYMDYLSVNGYSMGSSFEGCIALEKVRYFVLRGDYINRVFYGCQSLTCIGFIGIKGDKTDFFTGCVALTSPDSGEQATLTANSQYAEFSSPPATCD